MPGDHDGPDDPDQPDLPDDAPNRDVRRIREGIRWWSDWSPTSTGTSNAISMRPDVYTFEPTRLRLLPTPKPDETPRPAPIPPLRKHRDSSVNCTWCASPLDADQDAWPMEPGLALIQTDVDPRCPNPDCPSNGGTPYESEDSGVRLIGSRDDSDDDE